MKIPCKIDRHDFLVDFSKDTVVCRKCQLKVSRIELMLHESRRDAFRQAILKEEREFYIRELES